jgi:5-methyltetrahydropteroyltriglutamate--homocysteine methyltransferase
VRPGFSTPGTVPQVPLREQVCAGPLRYTGQEAIAKDVAALKAAIKGRNVEGFISALGPLSLGAGVRNKYYRNEEDYMMAVARTLREEYKAITNAGLILQIDEPEFATTWMFYPDWTVEDYRSYLEFAVEVINCSIDGLPEDQIRFHMCWGSGHRPHANDIELKYIADLLFRIKAQAYSFEASNVRHAHEWRVFEKVKLPPGKIIVPGVVGHSSDLIEHPEFVAERLVNFAKLVGMENVQAGTDCGIGSRVGHAEVAWAKLKSIAAGAAIATDMLKGQ